MGRAHDLVTERFVRIGQGVVGGPEGQDRDEREGQEGQETREEASERRGNRERESRGRELSPPQNSRYERGTKKAGSYSLEVVVDLLLVVGGAGLPIRRGVRRTHGSDLPLLHALNGRFARRADRQPRIVQHKMGDKMYSTARRRMDRKRKEIEIK